MSLLLRAFAQQSKCNLTLIRQVTALNLNRNLSLKQIICQKHVVKSDGGSQVGKQIIKYNINIKSHFNFSTTDILKNVLLKNYSN